MNLRIALFEPRIPQNTGNIGRTCAAFNLKLDLICPLGFSLDDKYLKRAGLDYWKYLKLYIHKDYKEFKESNKESRIIGFSKTGDKTLSETTFQYNDVLLFGREDNGLTESVRNDCDLLVEIPMTAKANDLGLNGVRSLNLSVACGIASYVAINQLNRL